jgi:hypothetical protein
VTAPCPCVRPVADSPARVTAAFIATAPNRPSPSSRACHHVLLFTASIESPMRRRSARAAGRGCAEVESAAQPQHTAHEDSHEGQFRLHHCRELKISSRARSPRPPARRPPRS